MRIFFLLQLRLLARLRPSWFPTVRSVSVTLYATDNNNGGVQVAQQHSVPLRRMFVGCDQKALLELLGLNSAISTYFCPWCTCTKDARTNVRSHVSFKARTHADLRAAGSQLATLTTDSARDKYRLGEGAGVKRSAGVLRSLLADFNLMVPDLLHLDLRISERLLSSFAAMLLTDDERTLLAQRLDTCKISSTVVFRRAARSTPTSPQYRVSLTGDQCELLWTNLLLVFVWPSISAGASAAGTPRVRSPQAVALKQQRDDFDAVLAAWVEARAALLKSAPVFDSASAITFLRQLTTAIERIDNRSLIVNNSMHVLLSHVPQCVAECAWRAWCGLCSVLLVAGSRCHCCSHRVFSSLVPCAQLRPVVRITDAVLAAWHGGVHQAHQAAPAYSRQLRCAGACHRQSGHSSSAARAHLGRCEHGHHSRHAASQPAWSSTAATHTACSSQQEAAARGDRMCVVVHRRRERSALPQRCQQRQRH